jgi:hypothetical protein
LNLALQDSNLGGAVLTLLLLLLLSPLQLENSASQLESFRKMAAEFQVCVQDTQDLPLPLYAALQWIPGL